MTSSAKPRNAKPLAQLRPPRTSSRKLGLAASRLRLAQDERYEIERAWARRDFTRAHRWLTAPIGGEFGHSRVDFTNGQALQPFQAAGVAFAETNPYAGVLWPRGHTKTTTFSIRKTAWEIGRDALMTYLVVSQAQPFARRLSRRVKRLMRTPQFVELFGDVAPLAGTTKDTEAEWERRGSLADEPTFVAVGQLGQVPGNRARRVLGDDVISRKDVLTRQQRDRVFEWFLTEVLPVANAPDSRVLLVGTRYHEDDLYGRLIRTEDDVDADVEHEEIERFEQERPWAFEIRSAIEDSAPLWPEVWPLWRLQRRRVRLGTPIFNLTYQNDPTGMGGNIIKRAWFRYPADEGIAYDPGRLVNLRAGIDLAATAKKTADRTAFSLWANDVITGKLWHLYAAAAWLDSGHKPWILAQLRRAWEVCGLTSDHRIASVNVEAVQFQSVFARELMAETGLPVKLVQAKVDKVERARPLAARYEEGAVIHHESLRGGEYETEAAAFNLGEHDDLVDAAVYGADIGDPLQVFV